MGPLSAFSAFFRGYVDFYGRSRRSEYAWMLVIQYSVFIANVFVIFMYRDVAFQTPMDSWDLKTTLGFGFAVFFMIATFIPWISLNIRRFHDMGRSGWFVAAEYGLMFVPVLGIIASWGFSIWLLLGRGTVGDNRFGPDPRGASIETFS